MVISLLLNHLYSRGVCSHHNGLILRKHTTLECRRERDDVLRLLDDVGLEVYLWWRASVVWGIHHKVAILALCLGLLVPLLSRRPLLRNGLRFLSHTNIPVTHVVLVFHLFEKHELVLLVHHLFSRCNRKVPLSLRITKNLDRLLLLLLLLRYYERCLLSAFFVTSFTHNNLGLLRYCSLNVPLSRECHSLEPHRHI